MRGICAADNRRAAAIAGKAGIQDQDSYMKSASGAYPILRTFKADGDEATVKSLHLWHHDYHLEPPQTAANDNNPLVNPTQVETRVDAISAERLVKAHAKGQYSADLHQERFERVKHAKKSPPAPAPVDAEAATIRYVDAVKMREWLGADADTLDMAVEPSTTFEDVGRHIGVTGDEAAAVGKQEVKEVAATFYERAA